MLPLKSEGIKDYLEYLHAYYKKTINPEDDERMLNAGNNMMDTDHHSNFNVCHSEIKDTDEFIGTSDFSFSLNKVFPVDKKIDLEDLVTEHDTVVCVRGIGGIGKTTMIKHILTQWAMKKLYHKSFELVYYFNCRELGDIIEDNLIDFLQFQHPSEFPTLSESAQESMASKTLIIMDGIDQLNKRNKVLMFEMVKSNKHAFKICITGRPNAIFDLHKQISDKVQLKVVDMTGLNAKDIRLMMESRFSSNSDQAHKVTSFLKQFQENDLLGSMTRTSSNLSLLCCLIDEKEGLNFIKSQSLFFTYIVFIILRRNHEKLGFQDQAFDHLCNNEIVITIIRLISELSFFALADEKCIMFNNDFGAYKNLLENSGFFIKYKTSKGDTYQLRYSILIDYFAGLHLFLKGEQGIRQLFYTKCPSAAWNSLPFFLAFLRFHEDPSLQFDDIFHSLLSKLKYRSSSWINSLATWLKGAYRKDPEELISKLFYHHFLYHDRSSFDINSSWYTLLSSMYEYKRIPAFIVDSLSIASSIRVSIYHHHTIKYLSYLFDHILSFEKGDIIEFSLCMDDGVVNAEEINMLDFLIKNSFSLTYDFPKQMKELTDESELDVLKTINKGLQKILPYISYITNFALDFSHVSMATVDSLCDVIVDANKNRDLLLELLKIKNCSEEKLLKIMKIVPCLDVFQLHTSYVTSKSIEILSESIQNSKTTRSYQSKPINIEFNDCGMTDQHLMFLSDSLPYIASLNLCNNKTIDKDAIKIICQTIQEYKGESLLKELVFTNLSDDDVMELLPILSSLDFLHLLESDELTLRVLQSMCDEIERKTKPTKIINLWFHENKHMKIDDMKNVFRNLQNVNVYISKMVKTAYQAKNA